MAILSREFSCLIPSYLWYRKYNFVFDRGTYFSFFVKEYLPMIALSWYAREDILVGILLFYVYELGYAFNDKTLIEQRYLLIARVLFAVLALSVLSTLSITLAVGIILIMLAFTLHNFLEENSILRVFTWTILNVGKIFLVGGVTGLLLLSMLILKRLGIYMKKKLGYGIHFGVEGVFFVTMFCAICYNFNIIICGVFLLLNIYVMREFLSKLFQLN